MLENLLGKLAKLQEKYPLIIVLLILTVTSFFAYYALQLETDSNFDVMFSDDTNTIQLKNLLASEFGSTDSLFIVAKIDEEVSDVTRVQDIRHPDVLKAMAELKASLESETFVNSVISLADVLELFYGRLPSTLEESKEMIQNLPPNLKESALPSLLSNDYRVLNMFVSVNVESKAGFLEKIEENARERIEQIPFPKGVTPTLTGEPILINRILKLLINDNIRTILFALIGVFLILWVYFKSWKIALFSTIPVAFTLIWLSGTLYLMDIKLTFMIASVGAMMIGMSVDYAIHLTHAFHEKIKEADPNPTKETVVGIGGALAASVATTAAGFLAMLIGVTPNSITQGTALSIGIAYAFIITIVFLPPLMILQRKFIYSKLDERLFKIIGKTDTTKTNLIDKFIMNLAKLQVKRPGTILLIVGIVTMITIPGFGLVYLDTEDEGWIPDDDPVLRSLEEVSFSFGGTESMNLLFILDRTQDYDPDSVRDLRDPRVMLPMSSLDSVVEEMQWVDRVDSPSVDIKQFNNNRVPQDIERIKEVIELNTLDTNFNKDYSIARFTIRADEIDYPEYNELMAELDGVPFPKEVSIVPQGGIPRDIELQAMMGSDTMKTSSIGVLLVITIASIFYLSFISGLMAFVPIVFAIIWTVGTMGYINLPFTILTTGMLAILMGMGIDFSIHIMHNIKLKLKKYKGAIEKAVPEALLSTGQALSVTTITTVTGFFALSFATLVNTRRLGWTLALGIFATFFSCMLIVPAVMILQHRRKLKKQKQLSNEKPHKSNRGGEKP